MCNCKHLLVMLFVIMVITFSQLNSCVLALALHEIFWRHNYLPLDSFMITYLFYHLIILWNLFCHDLINEKLSQYSPRSQEYDVLYKISRHIDLHESARQWYLVVGGLSVYVLQYPSGTCYQLGQTIQFQCYCNVLAITALFIYFIWFSSPLETSGRKNARPLLWSRKSMTKYSFRAPVWYFLH